MIKKRTKRDAPGEENSETPTSRIIIFRARPVIFDAALEGSSTAAVIDGSAVEEEGEEQAEKGKPQTSKGMKLPRG